MVAKVDIDACTGCSACVDSCPVECIKMEDDKAVILEGCIDCGACVAECPVECISIED